MAKKRKEKRKIDRLKQRILDSLNDKVVLSNNRGVFIDTPFKLSKKDRRRSGWETPKICGKMKYSEIIEQCLEPKEEYDEWNSYKDGYRKVNCDRTHFFIPRYCRHLGFFSEEDAKKFNKKIKKQLAIRKAKKRKFKQYNYQPMS